MLSLRSFRDYPLAFSSDRGHEFLSASERQEYEALSFGPGRVSWLLSRIAAKELVQRYCDTRHRFVPEIADVSLCGEGNGQLSVSIRGSEERSLPQLRVSTDTADHFVVTCLRPVDKGETFAVTLGRVDAEYPFVDRSSLHEREWSQVRFASNEESDRTLAGFRTARRALGRLGIQGTEVVIENLSLKGECIVHPREGARNHVGCWAFDHYTLALAVQWQAPHPGPPEGAKVEEPPVLPEARHSEVTL